MKNNKMTSHIIILGIIVLCVFSYVTAVNLLPENISSNQFFSKVDEKMIAKIEKYEVIDNELVVTTSGEALSVCIKTTKSTPNTNSICWSNITNNEASIAVYPNKKYYIWLKDKNNNISSGKIYNPNK